MVGKLTIAFVRKEAEAYHAHGLHHEAVNLYTRLLGLIPESDVAFRSAIENRIQIISRDLADDEPSEGQISAGEIAQLRQGWSAASDAERLICAEAFMQIGCHREALKELVGPLRRGKSEAPVGAAVIECLTRLYPPAAMHGVIDRLVAAVASDPARAAALRRDLRRQYAQRREAGESLTPAAAPIAADQIAPCARRPEPCAAPPVNSVGTGSEGPRRPPPLLQRLSLWLGLRRRASSGAGRR
jgi:hypothetical protein